MRKAIFLIIIFFFVCNLCYSQIHRGTLNIIDFPEDQPIHLNGEWKFYPEKLLEPREVDGINSGKPVYLTIPGTWNSQGLKGRSYGTYSLKILNVPKGRMLAIKMPNVYSSYKLFIDDKEVASDGKVGTDKDAYQPKWKMTAISFIPEHSSINLTLQVANFDHFRGGVHKEILLGTYDVIQSDKENSLLANMLLFAGLMVLGIFCLMMFIIQYDKEKLNILFFALICIAWAIRAFFAHIYLRTVFLPEFDWSISIRIEYIFLYISLILGNLFVKTSYKLKDQLLFNLVMIINIIMIGCTVIFQPVVFTSLLTVYQLIAMLNLIYLGYMIILAINIEIKEAWLSGVSIVIAIAVFLVELFAYQFQWQINHIILNSSYLMVFMLNSLVLAYQSTLGDKKFDEMEETQLTMFR